MKKNIKFFGISIFFLSMLFLTNCVSYTIENAVPGPDTTIFVTGHKQGTFNAGPKIWKCDTTADAVKCNKELVLEVDDEYWRSGYFKSE